MIVEKLHFSKIDSTNALAKRYIQGNDIDPEKLLVISANEQTGGYGQFKRKFITAPEKNLIVSFCFTIPSISPSPPDVTAFLAKAVIEVLKTIGIKAKHKKPNDIFINNKKLGGILAEIISEKDSFWIVIGLGLNINNSEEWLAKIDQPATSLFVETKKKYDIKDLCQLIQNEFIKNGIPNN